MVMHKNVFLAIIFLSFLILQNLNSIIFCTSKDLSYSTVGKEYELELLYSHMHQRMHGRGF